MSTTAQELKSFTQFAKVRLAVEDVQPSLDELLDLWRMENPSEVTLTENLSALPGAIDDFKNGDRGPPAGQLSQELPEELGVD